LDALLIYNFLKEIVCSQGQEHASGEQGRRLLLGPRVETFRRLAHILKMNQNDMMHVGWNTLAGPKD